MRSIKFVFVILISFLACSIQAQNVEDNIALMNKVKARPSEFLFAEGAAATFDEAKNLAIQYLSEQIQVDVKSSTDIVMKEIQKGDEVYYEEYFKRTAEVSSKLKLSGCKALMIGVPSRKNKDYVAFAYISKVDINKTLADIKQDEENAIEKRKDDIKYFYENGQHSLKTLRIGDALKSFYSGYVLAKGTPCKLSVGGEKVPADKHLESMINNVLGAVQVEVTDVNEEILNGIQSNFKISLLFTYRHDGKTEKITNIDFIANAGDGWSNNIRVKDGLGVVEADRKPETIVLQCIYRFGKNEYGSDLWPFIEKDGMIFNAATKSCPVQPKQKVAPKVDRTMEVQVERQVETIAANTRDVTHNHDAMLRVMNEVEQAIRQTKPEKVHTSFTEEAWTSFKKIFLRGKVEVLGQPEYNFVDFEDLTLCRSILLRFRYSNNKEFIEELTFRFNEDNKIESFAYMMPEADQNAILRHTDISEKSRMSLLTFMEDYQTAYALGNLKYLQTVFSEDALIITGRKIRYKNRDVEIDTTIYKRWSKSAYLDNLETQFDRREYINLNFTETEFREAANCPDVFGIQLRQEYFSSVYGDVGYLFLFVDLRGEDPVIQIRAWNEDHIPVNDRFSLKDVQCEQLED